MERALSAGDGSCLVVVEGPVGSGLTTVLRAAAVLAVRRGVDVGWLRGGPDGDAVADPCASHLLGPAPRSAAVLCVDELQWLDEHALQRVGALLEQPASMVVVGALRTGTPPVAPRRLDALRATATGTVELTRLRVEHARRMLAAAGARDDPALAERCVELTGGSPALLRLVAERLAGGDGAPSADAVAGIAAPLLAEVGRSWASEIGRCGEDAPAIVDAALVLGDDPPLWLTAELAGVARADAAPVVDALVGIGLLAAADPVRFAAPLVHDALDARVSGAWRDELHRRAAQLLARTADGAERAAGHLLAAPPCGEAWPADSLREAAEIAGERGDHGVAVTRLERALAEPLPPAVRCEVLVELGSARDRAGQPGADDAYRQALRVADAREHPRIHLLLGRTRFGAGDYGGAVGEFDRGLYALADDDDPLAVELVAGYVAAARFDGTLEGETQRRLAPLLDRTTPGRTTAERALLAEIALERAIRGAPRDEVIALAHRAWAGGRLLDGADAYGIALSQVAAVLTWSGAFEDSERVLSSALDRAQRDSEAHVAATARYLRAWPRYYRGALADAEADVRFALTGPAWEMYEPSARAVLAHVLIEAGDEAGARDALALTDADPWLQTPPYAMLLEARARLHVAASDLDAAARDLTAAGEILVTMGSRHPFCPWRSRLGLVTARRGEPEAARRLVDEELAQAREIGVPRALGVALRAHALLEEIEGRDAERDLRAAAEVLDSCGARVDQARALTDLGRVLADGERRHEARARLRDALDLAEAMGATEIAARARRELGRAGGRIGRSPADAPAGLTGSELLVARLAAGGRTNRQIAEELVVTPHTVRFHLGNAYRKLGVSSREELPRALRG